MYVCVFVWRMCTCTYLHEWVCMYVCFCVHVWVLCMVRVHVYESVCLSMHSCLSMHVCAWICMYVYVLEIEPMVSYKIGSYYSITELWPRTPFVCYKDIHHWM